MAAPRTAQHHYRASDIVLDADMTPADITAALVRLRFANNRPFHSITFDIGVRDFLVDALRRRRLPAEST
jgi:hypothetical protein